ncbi:MAG: tetratricopeptide repeat protein, partial [Frankiales bacterium]
EVAAAHNVPLHLLATGGLVVALAYLALVAVTLLALVRGLRSLEGNARLRLAGLGGGWVAYQVQSLVSIDQVPLVVLNFVLSAAVVVASGTSRLKHLRLPGALPVEPERPAGRRRAASVAPRVRATTPGDVVLLGVISVVGLTLLWMALVPLRADVAIRSGDNALRRGDGNASLAAYDKAIDLLPGRAAYWARKASLMTNVQPETALSAYDGAIKADPSNAAALRSAGALAEAEGQLERARSYFTRAVEVDPYNPGTVTAAATFELRHGGAAAARELLEAAVARTPGQAALWTPLGDARQVLGDLPGAIEAYELAISLDPAQTKAAAELEKLQRTS